MRISRLDLIRYGGFADRRHDFSASPVDLQILYGANEAGKSTTLAAIGDLLFGFPHHKGQDWRFDAAQLRVGADLEHEGAQLSLIRRRGNRQTLLAGDGATPLDENTLLRWLGGVDRGEFERLWSLDHERLRLGGEAMAHFEDDLGQQLLAAGFGLDNVQGVLQGLDAEAGAIWRKNGRSTRLNELKNRLGEARRNLAAAEKDSQRWAALNRESEEIDADLQALQSGLKTLLAERATLERISRLRNDLEHHARLGPWLASQGKPLFDREEHRVFEELLSRYVASQQKRDRLAELHQGALAIRKACVPDPALLAHENRIDSFQTQHANLTPLRDAWPQHEQTLIELGLTLRAAGLEGEPATILPTLPDLTLLARLRPLASQHDHLARREAECRLALQAAGDRLALARTRLAGTGNVDLASLSVALQQAERREAVDSECASLDRDHHDATTRLAQCLRDLTPWQGTIEALHAIAVPDAATLDRYAAAWAARRTQQDSLEAAIEALSVSMDRQNLARNHLEQRQIVSHTALVAARRERDLLFGSFASAPSDQTIRNRYLDASIHADTLADRRFADAEESAKLTQIEQEIDRLGLEQTHLEEKRAALATLEATARHDWQTLLTGRALPKLPPQILQGWLVLRERALTEAATLDRLDARRAELVLQRTTALALLKQALPDMPMPETVADGLVWARNRLAVWQRKTDRQSQIRSDIEQEERSLSAETRKSTILADERRALIAAWAEATAQSTARNTPQHCDGVDSLERLASLHAAAFDAVRIQEMLDSQKCEVGALDAAITAFAAGLQRGDDLAQRPAALCLDSLVRGLKQARLDRDKARDYDLDVARNAHALEEAEKAVVETTMRFQPFMRRLPVDILSGDASERAPVDTLRAIFTHEAACYAAQDELSVLEQRMRHEAGDTGFDALHEQAHAWPAERIAPRLAVLDAEQDRAERQREDRIRRQGEIANDMKQIEQAHNARDAALEIETCRTEMASAAEAWATARIQSMILTHVAKRQRDEMTNPLLKSAQAHFMALTCGRYRRLTIAEDGKAPELAALLDDERLIRPGAMSEGTRDQLFLSLRLAALDQARARGVALPFIADDLFITFDEARAEAGFDTLARMAAHGQVVFMTHHAHLAEMAGRFGGARHNV